jgi:squalene-hopene/tetraprenyl-beta-curcumene cyclase
MTPQEALDSLIERLYREQTPEGFWEGCLSSSALATAVAVSALSLGKSDEALVAKGLQWLEQTRNDDGGWGDTPESISNPSTTMLVVAAFKIAREQDDEKARGYLHAVLGQDFADGIRSIYGEDRTFAVPILMTCAAAGLVNWNDVPRLPYELALFPHRLYRLMKLQVVSYALPALIAVGISIDKHQGQSKMGRIAEKKVLEKLTHLQPSSGGFLEATPLTAFVALSLLSCNTTAGKVVEHCLTFLRNQMREDGSWPIDANLSTWLTTSAVNALRAADYQPNIQTLDWIASCQFQEVHPFTNADPGGWGWTNLSGSVPDGDDTSGALLALCDEVKAQVKRTGHATQIDLTRSKHKAGLKWLLDLQNRDGGWPAFCKGWGKLPFDQSSPDITAHAIRALNAHGLGDCHSAENGFKYLEKAQRGDGSWSPLWFGSQLSRTSENLVLGTARVLMAYGELRRFDLVAQKGLTYLLEAQDRDGGWGAFRGAKPTAEETALALSALSFFRRENSVSARIDIGIERLIRFIEQDGLNCPQPIGLYFAKLWYSERLYPVIWAIEALGRNRVNE